MAKSTPFRVMDCALLTRMSGLPPVVNLRELRDRVSVCAEDVIYHHFCETWLRPTFDNPDYRNDLALWAKNGLLDRVLAERLAIIDPYDYGSIELLRTHLIDIFEDRLGELQPWVPMVRAGNEFYFMQATTVVFDTGEQVSRAKDLAAVVERMTNGSVYFHFLDARRRSSDHLDDFSTWLLASNSGHHDTITALQGIDFYFSDLDEIRREIVEVLKGIGGRK